MCLSVHCLSIVCVPTGSSLSRQITLLSTDRMRQERQNVCIKAYCCIYCSFNDLALCHLELLYLQKKILTLVHVHVLLGTACVFHYNGVMEVFHAEKNLY